MATETSFTFKAGDGVSIATYRWQSAAPVRGIVQLAHGLGEHALRYRGLAHALVEAGYALYANDHRGHGRTARDHHALGDFGAGGFTALVRDMVLLTGRAKADHPGKPLILLGHSMGSFAAQLYVLDNAALVDGVAMSGTAALDLRIAAQRTGRLQDNNEAFEPARTPFDWLSRDPAVVDAYVADPLCGFSLNAASRDSLVAASAHIADVTQLKRIRHDLPIFLFVGDRDPVNGNLAWFHPLVARYRDAGLTDVTCHVYEGGRHEMLNEINRAEVIGNLIAWIDRVCAAP